MNAVMNSYALGETLEKHVPTNSEYPAVCWNNSAVSSMAQRKKAIVKLKELKLQFDLRKSDHGQTLSFYQLLNDIRYRELKLLKLCSSPNKAIANLAMSVLELDIEGSLLDGDLNLGEDVILVRYQTN